MLPVCHTLVKAFKANDLVAHMTVCECIKVRQSRWYDRPAVYKVGDMRDSLEPLLNVQAELDAYREMVCLWAGML